MTNNTTIDDVSRNALEQALLAMKRIYQAGYDRILEAGGQCDTPEYMMAGDPTARELRALLDAPAVERQEPKPSQVPVLRAMAANYRNGHSWDFLDGEAVSKAADEITAQASTIAQLQARVQELESGKGEQPAPFYISVDDWNLLVRGDIAIANARVSRAKRGHFTEPLFTAPPAPAAVVPDGWKLVPVEPTELMIRRGDQNYSWSVAKIYKAMIEDAPACLDATAALNGPGK